MSRNRWFLAAITATVLLLQGALALAAPTPWDAAAFRAAQAAGKPILVDVYADW
jgi:thiol:disulfide interchange protein